ncbi:diguanylate cyclase [Chromobacterium sp. IIBBL 290-4]|uniref:GGDEF domain-containing protein n=1 Tax=Chromobacterium sp. IIBBL 290-4 TaxID=2953890 RepID=UPI0020B711A4|nr:diguanylate cyclase [Chromobacterium sp. IIBBL 290-4]UTH75807.1 diguanylate cyclase [Chromobacterium sp. IIBBL 290-4]
MKQAVPIHPSQRAHLAREIDRIGYMLVSRWERPLAAHLLSLVLRLEELVRTIGLGDIAAEAHTLARLLQQWLQQPLSVPSEQERYGQLRHHLGVVSQLGLMERQIAIQGAEVRPPDGGYAPLYLWLPPNLDASTLQRQLACFGYEVTVLSQAAKLAKALQEATPAAVVAFTDFAESDPIVQLAPAISSSCPLVLTSARRDFPSRLAAARMGASGFLDWPLQAHQLVDLLSFGDIGERRDPLRVLIVEDMASLAGLYTRVLAAHGVEATSETNPENVPELIERLNPDLILMDMYMPQCNGIELAKVIRQQRMLDGIPIVFLSVEKRQAVQLDALTLGIDGFLTKPVAPEELVVTVMNRARRYRKLRSYIANDSLTGLLNHSHLHGQMDSGIVRARRDQLPLSLAMIDLDYFKKINDTYGHQAGDQVLLNLARFLKERLRRSDLVGRYGGEEFAIVLPSTPVDKAHQMMDALRQDFSQLEQRAEERSFRQTFSAGISSLDTADNATSLVQQADEMLYRAKANGRNRVESRGD